MEDRVIARLENFVFIEMRKYGDIYFTIFRNVHGQEISIESKKMFDKINKKKKLRVTIEEM